MKNVPFSFVLKCRKWDLTAPTHVLQGNGSVLYLQRRVSNQLYREALPVGRALNPEWRRCIDNLLRDSELKPFGVIES